MVFAYKIDTLISLGTIHCNNMSARTPSDYTKRRSITLPISLVKLTDMSRNDIPIGIFAQHNHITFNETSVHF